LPVLSIVEGKQTCHSEESFPNGKDDEESLFAVPGSFAPIASGLRMTEKKPVILRSEATKNLE